MGPEFVFFTLLTGTAMLPTRERGDALIVATRWTCDSETPLSTTPSETWLCGTGDIEAAPTVEDLVRNASKLVQALSLALPPVDLEAEASLDKLMAERRRLEPRRLLVPRT